MEDIYLSNMIKEIFGESAKELIGGSAEERAPQLQASQKQAAAPPAAPQPPRPPQPRHYMEKIRGTANYVLNHSNEFFRYMEEKHPTFRVISTNAVELPDSICMYITYTL